jgi:protoporphyrinogen IX oxidase
LSRAPTGDAITLAAGLRARQTGGMDWVKIIHLLCVMGWMTSIFAVPRALIYWKREYARLGEFGPLGDLTIRLYRFSAGLGVIALITGIWLGWQVWGLAPWVWVKLALVLALAGHYGWTGVLVVRAKAGVFRESDFFLRVFNEISVVGAIAILWVVVVKPF